ncbi:MAG TPA: hypothetical protein VLT62_17050 [Candidatus Methylomirabilis sp.]|nr:hypothetical protein [Candidatus Methylomirabilis sp.]
MRWFEEIVRTLEGAQAGVLCLTSENLVSPWLHFEAGALAKGLHKSPDTSSDESQSPLQNRIFTYLHGVSAASLAGPLAQYQSTATTREDTWSLIKALVGVLFPNSHSDASLLNSFETAWPGFEKDLKGIAVTVQELLPEFEGWFRRKTFDEPLEHCTDQNWPARYDGARQTHDRLSNCAGPVRKACPRYQVDLYEQLLAVVESYAMDIRALLLKAPTFKLGESGRLVVEPEGILRACEDRRGHIKEIVSRMLDPLAVPATEEAAAFWLTDSFDQRKMLVHRLEHAVLEQRDRQARFTRGARLESVGRSAGRARGEEHLRQKPDGDLPGPHEARKLFENIWDLDRIFGYLVTEYLYPDAAGTVDVLRQAAVMELERFRAKREGATLMPLHYALGAMKAALAETKHGPRTGLQAPAVEKLLAEIGQLIDDSRPADGGEPTLDKGRQVRRTLAEIRSFLRPSRPHRDSTRSAATVRAGRRRSSRQSTRHA